VGVRRSVKVLSVVRAGKCSLICLLVLLGGIVWIDGAEADRALAITRESLLGRWRGGDLSDLNCILWFEKERVRILTFREDKHLSTVFSTYHVPRRGQKITLGINGSATVLPDGDIQLNLTREFTHITVLREATLRRMPTTK
jgi:hypothetical protein